MSTTRLQNSPSVIHLKTDSLLEVERFIEATPDRKTVIVEVNRTGIGDACADRLEEHGFVVRRLDQTRCSV